MVDEVTYGTPVATNKSYVFNTESIEGSYENKIRSAGLKHGEALVNADRVDTNPKGAKGGLELEFDHRYFGFLMKHCLGSVSTGATLQGITTHTYVWGGKEGKSFTLQKKMVGSDGTAYPKTYQGGKIVSWEISTTIDGYVMLKLELDFQKENLGAGAGALALQSPNYATVFKTFKFYETSITIGGSTFNATEFSLKWTNNLDTERYYLNGSGLKSEPVQDGHDEAVLEIKNDFVDLAQELRVASTNESDCQAQVVITATATEAEGAGGLAGFTITLPKVSFDVATATIDGPARVSQSVTGNVLWPYNAEPITMVLNTPDATV